MLRDKNVCQRASSRNAFIDDMRRHRCLDRRLTLPAHQLAAHVALDGGCSPRVIELLADALADALDLAATTADGRLRFTMNVHARQVGWKRRTALFV
jgi:hypothetical protein